MTIWPDPPAVPAGTLIFGQPTWLTGWADESGEVQIPVGFTLEHSRENGEAMLWTSKKADNAQGTATIEMPSTAWGGIELVHKLSVPPDEMNGAIRQLVGDGEEMYVKSQQNTPAWHRLRRKFRGTPGQRAHLVVEVSAESADIPQSLVHPGSLESDHLRFSLKWGGQFVERTYAEMQGRRDVRLADGSVVDRPFNRFVLTDVFPASGELEMIASGQSNWPRTHPVGGSDFFYSRVMVIAAEDAPPPGETPDLEPEFAHLLMIATGLAAQADEIDEIAAQSIVMRARAVALVALVAEMRGKMG
jgi:hypothetical protein